MADDDAMTGKLAFLSEEWIAAARALRAAHRSESPPGVPVRMNLVVEQVPFGEGQLEAYLDTTAGFVDIEIGTLEQADVRVALDYETARAILVDADSQAALQAFMAGRIRVEGDLAKLLQYQSTPPEPAQLALSERIRAITA
jgi:hypothetical protein